MMCKLLKIVWLISIQCFSVVFCLSLVPSKLYRVERFNIYNCVKNTTIDWIIFNKSTLKIVGGIDKQVIDGWFELLEDITTDVSMYGNIAKCGLTNVEQCNFNDEKFGIPSLCGNTKKGEGDVAQYFTDMQMRSIVKSVLDTIVPPISCPIIKKNKYEIKNFTIDLKVLNVFPLELFRWIIRYTIAVGPTNIPVICFDLESTVRKLGGRKRKN